MDVGLSRILEVFEERFGRIATNILVGAVGVALFFYSVRVIIEAILEFHKIITEQTKNVSDNIVTALSFIVQITVGACFAYIFMEALYRFYIIPRLKRAATAIAASESKELRESVTKSIEKTEANIDQADHLMKRAETALDKTLAARADVDRKLNELEKRSRKSKVLKRNRRTPDRNQRG